MDFRDLIKILILYLFLICILILVFAQIKPIEEPKAEKSATFYGYAVIWDHKNQNEWVFLKGAFKDSIDKQAALNKELNRKTTGIKLLWNHDEASPIGIITRVFEDAKGLWMEGELNLAVGQAREVFALLKQGALDAVSIGCTNGLYRLIKKVKVFGSCYLDEISIVAIPAEQYAAIYLNK